MNQLENEIEKLALNEHPPFSRHICSVLLEDQNIKIEPDRQSRPCIVAFQKKKTGRQSFLMLDPNVFSTLLCQSIHFMHHKYQNFGSNDSRCVVEVNFGRWKQSHPVCIKTYVEADLFLKIMKEHGYQYRERDRERSEEKIREYFGGVRNYIVFTEQDCVVMADFGEIKIYAMEPNFIIHCDGKVTENSQKIHEIFMWIISAFLKDFVEDKKFGFSLSIYFSLDKLFPFGIVLHVDIADYIQIHNHYKPGGLSREFQEKMTKNDEYAYKADPLKYYNDGSVRGRRRGEDRRGEEGTGEERRVELRIWEDRRGEDGPREDGSREDGMGGVRIGEDRGGEDRQGEDRQGKDGRVEDRRGENRRGDERRGEDRRGEDRRGGLRSGEDKREGVNVNGRGDRREDAWKDDRREDRWDDRREERREDRRGDIGGDRGEHDWADRRRGNGKNDVRREGWSFFSYSGGKWGSGERSNGEGRQREGDRKNEIRRGKEERNGDFTGNTGGERFTQEEWRREEMKNGTKGMSRNTTA